MPHPSGRTADAGLYGHLEQFARRLSAGLRRGSPTERRPQILVDVSVIYTLDAKTGIQRVVRAVWVHLQEMAPAGFDLVAVAATRRRSYHIVSPDFLGASERPPLKTLPTISVRQEGDIFFGLDLAAHVVPRRARELKRWQRQGCRLVFMIYDLLPARHPEWFSEKLVRNFRAWLGFVGRHADQAICISSAVSANLRDWLTSHLGTNRDMMVQSIRLGGDLDASVPSSGMTPEESAMLHEADSGPILLCVGTIEPRKGHAVLLAAFEKLAQRRPDVKLVFVGRPGWKTDALQQRMRELHAGGSNFFWFAGSSDEFLVQLYSRCALVIVPSFDEGFGLPIVEALRNGCQVLARDIPVFRELAHPAVEYFASDDPDRLSDEILSLAGGGRRIFSPVSETSWNECVEAIAKALGVAGHSTPQI